MKILTAEQFSALKKKADDFDQLIQHILENSEGIAAEDVTAEAIAGMLRPSGTETEDATSGLQAQLKELRDKLSAAETKNEALQREVELLKTLPAEEPTLKTPAGEEHPGDLEEVLAFARKNPGDTRAITDKLNELGLN